MHTSNALQSLRSLSIQSQTPQFQPILKCTNVDLILINPRVIAKSKCQNVITNPAVIAKSNQPKPKDLEASKSNVYYWLLLLWAMTTGAQLMDLDTLNYGGLGPHPRGGGGGGGGFLL